MSSKLPLLAKFCRPRCHDTFRRPRLLARLDSAYADRRCVFIMGPPGAGKTTLVSSWLERESEFAVWYQLDAGDNDIASFFHHLALAIRAHGFGRSRSLPALTPELERDLSAFSRRYFRDLFSRMPEGSLLVFDNFQVTELALQAVVSEALEQRPSGVTLIVLSRDDMPRSFARAIVHCQAELITATDLKANEDEVTAFGRGRTDLSVTSLLALHHQCGGWMAGLSLLLDRASKGEPVDDLLRPENLHVVFSYLSTHVFNREPEEVRELLRSLCLVPEITPELASRLSGSSSAVAVLTDLHRRGLFVECRHTPEVVFQFHALLKNFLVHRLEQDVGFDQMRTRRRISASTLAEAGLHEAAIDLYLEIGDYATAAALLVDSARSLLASGRWRTLRGWIGRFPSTWLNKSPWLRYWLGVAQAGIDPVAGRTELERCFQLFARHSDSIGQMLCATEILRAFFIEFRSLERVDPWIDILSALVRSHGPGNDPDIAMAIYSGLLGALVSRRPRHQDIENCVGPTASLLPSATDANLALSAGISLSFYATMSGRVEMARHIAAGLEPHLTSEHLSPVLQVFWFGSYGYLKYVAGDPLDAIRQFERAELLAAESGLEHRIQFIRAWHAYCIRRTGDIATAEGMAVSLERNATDAIARSGALWLRALNARSRGRLDLAVEWGEKALHGAVSDCTLHGAQHLQQAEMLLEMGDSTSAQEWILEARRLIDGTFSASAWRPVIRLLEALVALQSGCIGDCQIALGEALALVRDGGQVVFLRWFRHALTRLLPKALEWRLEIQVATALIQELGLDPDAIGAALFPWPVRIHTQDGLEIEIKGRTLAFGRKPPAKALSLLSHLIAMGGKEVSATRLSDSLWPDAEGDQSHQLLKATLHRLRRLLGSPDLIVQHGGRISLDRRRCWVDVFNSPQSARKDIPSDRSSSAQLS